MTQTTFQYNRTGLDRLACAVIVRAHKDAKGHYDAPADEVEPETLQEAREWMNAYGRDWVDTLRPVRMRLRLKP